MNAQYTKQIKKYLPKIYKTYLLRYADEKQITQMFDNKNVKNAFYKVIELFFKNSEFGNKYNDEIKSALKDYEKTMLEQVGFSDEYLRQFLHIYRFYAGTIYPVLVDSNNRYKFREEKNFFKQRSYICCEACENLFVDLQNGNRWWEVDCASTLRRQFLNDRVVLPEHRIQKLCREYLGREINIEKELHLREGKKTPPLELVKELDEKMAKRGYNLVYAWVEEVNGVNQMVNSTCKPTDGRFYIKKYVNTKESTNQK